MKYTSNILAVILSLACFNSEASAKECKPGDKAKVLWNGYHFQATLKSKKADKLCVHYDGWDAMWDECVEAKRFTCKGDSAFATGETVEVEWGAQFWEAKILSLKAGKFCVTYKGWESKWDECVGAERVRQK